MSGAVTVAIAEGDAAAIKRCMYWYKAGVGVAERHSMVLGSH